MDKNTFLKDGLNGSHILYDTLHGEAYLSFAMQKQNNNLGNARKF